MEIVMRGKPAKFDGCDPGDMFLANIDGHTRYCLKVSKSGVGPEPGAGPISSGSVTKA